jgi:nitrite reductase/ring-hydroxylating ferredoxin subunit
MMELGFPYEDFPRGWFQVAWSDDLKAGDVLPLHYFGRELVLFRGESGRSAVLDAYCAHLGAHLGYGGTVSGDCIACPFHEWQWDADGHNTHIPHSTRESQRRRVPAWSVSEEDGIIAVWHDPEGQAPTWQAPRFGRISEGDYVSENIFWKAATIQPQFPVENIVDQFHFSPVHRSNEPAALQSFAVDGVQFRSTLKLVFGQGKDSTALTPEGPSMGIIDVIAHGLGFIDFEFADVAQTKYVMSTTPIDHETSDIRMSIFLSRDQATTNGELNDFGRATINEMVKQTDRDLSIFGHWRYNSRAPFTPEEAPAYNALRQWARQFYSEALQPTALNA